MRVKKDFGGKRKGYKGKLSIWDMLKGHMGRNWGKYMLGEEILRHGMGGKHGGRVTARGIGKAKRGFGKVLRKK